MTESRSIVVRNEGDVINARLQTRQMAKEAGLQIMDQARISLAVSSLAHVVRLGESHQGRIVINHIQDSGRSGVQVVWMLNSDEDCSDVMESLESTAWSLMVDDVNVETMTNEGICIKAIKWADQRGGGYRTGLTA